MTHSPHWSGLYCGHFTAALRVCVCFFAVLAWGDREWLVSSNKKRKREVKRINNIFKAVHSAEKVPVFCISWPLSNHTHTSNLFLTPHHPLNPVNVFTTWSVTECAGHWSVYIRLTMLASGTERCMVVYHKESALINILIKLWFIDI